MCGWESSTRKALLALSNAGEYKHSRTGGAEHLNDELMLDGLGELAYNQRASLPTIPDSHSQASSNTQGCRDLYWG